ncbi:MAG: hypothetical protein ACOYI3_05560 [Christensenellales bacterium]
MVAKIPLSEGGLGERSQIKNQFAQMDEILKTSEGTFALQISGVQSPAGENALHFVHTYDKPGQIGVIFVSFRAMNQCLRTSSQQFRLHYPMYW